MATITNRSDRNVFAGRHLAAAGVVRLADRRDAEIDAAYEEAREILDADRRLADERAAMVEAFVAAHGDWTAELHVLAQAHRFDVAHPSRDPLFEELHAEQLYGQQYGEVA